MSGISIDLTPIWNGINQNLPFFMSILAPVIGISAAMYLAAWIAGSILRAFRGGGAGGDWGGMVDDTEREYPTYTREEMARAHFDSAKDSYETFGTWPSWWKD